MTDLMSRTVVAMTPLDMVPAPDFNSPMRPEDDSNSDDAATVCAPEDTRRNYQLPTPTSRDPPPSKPRRLPHPSPHEEAHPPPKTPPPPRREPSQGNANPPSSPPPRSRPRSGSSPRNLSEIPAPPPPKKTPSPPPRGSTYSPPPPRPPPRRKTPVLPPPPPPPLPPSTPPLLDLPPPPPPPPPPLPSSTPQPPDYSASDAKSHITPPVKSQGSKNKRPPPPPSSPGPDVVSTANGGRIYCPTPRRAADLPHGDLRRRIILPHEGASSDEDSSSNGESTQFPPTYPARHRRARPSRSRSRTKIDMTRSIANTVAQLEEQRRNAKSGQTTTQTIPQQAAGREIQKLWANLGQQRQNLYEVRQDMVRDRLALQELRRRRIEADNKMLAIVRHLLPKLGKLGNSLRQSHLEAQTLWAEYGTQELDYERRELAVDNLEKEVVSLEMQFFAILSQQQGVLDDQGNGTSPGQKRDKRAEEEDVPWQLKGIARDKPLEDIHPLYEEFQSSIGEFGIAQESWHELQTTKQAIDSKINITQHLEVTGLDEEEMEFLDNFQEEERRRVEDLQECQARVYHLKALCKERGIMPKHLSFQMVYLLHKFFPGDEDNPELVEDIDLPDNPEDYSHTNARPVFPRLLAQERHLFGDFPILPSRALEIAEALPEGDIRKPSRVHNAEEEVFLDRIFTDMPRKNTMAFINRWLYHQLRLSPFMAHTLLNTLGDEAKRVDVRAWEEEVLRTWWDDSRLSVGRPEASTVQYAVSEESSSIFGMVLDLSDSKLIQTWGAEY